MPEDGRETLEAETLYSKFSLTKVNKSIKCIVNVQCIIDYNDCQKIPFLQSGSLNNWQLGCIDLDAEASQGLIFNISDLVFSFLIFVII